jgi:hypothetical protein
LNSSKVKYDDDVIDNRLTRFPRLLPKIDLR